MELNKEKNIDYIQRILPHRYPFLMIDRIVDMEPGKYIRGYKNISCNEKVFNGHFHDYPIFPGVLIIEATAQLGGFLFMKQESDGDLEKSDLVFICGVDKTKFIRFAVPGDRLDIECFFEESFHNFLKVRGVVKVKQQIICKTELTYTRTAITKAKQNKK